MSIDVSTLIDTSVNFLVLLQAFSFIQRIILVHRKKMKCSLSKFKVQMKFVRKIFL